MNAPATTSVDLTDLVVLDELGDGGQGTVYRVEVPGIFPNPMAFKRYSPASLAELQPEALEQLIAAPLAAGDDVRTRITEQMAWPVATVHREGTVCGFLMPLAPDDLRSYLRFASGYEARPLAMEFLLNPVEYMANVDLPVTERSRLALLRGLADLLRVLHRRAFVVGDLSPKNVLISLRPPRCYLLDCDGMRVNGQSVLPQVETPDWSIPAGEELATMTTDRFKFGLLVIRLLRSDQSESDPESLRAGQPGLADLAARNASATPDARPELDEWLAAIDAAMTTASDEVPTVTLTTRRPAPQPARAAPQNPSPVAPVPTGSPTSRPKTRRNLVLLGIAVFAVLCIWGIASKQTPDTGSGYTPPLEDTATAAEGLGDQPDRSTATTTPFPGSMGVVDLTALATPGPNERPAVVAMAQLFDSYFSGINAKNWDLVMPLYDPAGTIDPANSRHRDAFIDGASTTADSEVRLLDVNLESSPALAHVSFRSSQAAGYGPKPNPDETCTRWDITYQLSATGASYRILGSPGAIHTAC